MAELRGVRGAGGVLVTLAGWGLITAACSVVNAPEDPLAPDGTGGSGATTPTGGSGGGQCVNAADCSALQDDCHDGECQDGACVAVPANEGGVCDDGIPCTEEDRCTQGVCAGVDVVCGEPTACASFVCNEGSGQCEPIPEPDDTPCDDGNPCTGDGICQGGACTVGPLICDALTDECNIGVCQGGVGCVPQPIGDGQPCAAGDICGEHQCSGGSCVVVQPLQPNGFPCDDGIFCTSGDACLAGACTAPDPTCPPSDFCATRICDEQAQICNMTPQNDGAACDDGSACTSGETCSAGACGNPITINPIVFFEEDFSDNTQGWTLGTEWQIGPAQASPPATYSSADPALDHTPTADNGVAGAVIGGNVAEVLHDFYYLESPPFNTAGSPSVLFSFWRWLNSDYDPYMHNVVEVFDGSAWVQLWISGPSPAIMDDPNATGGVGHLGWTYVELDITAYASPFTRVRFGFDITSTSVFTCGSWNIDDVLVNNCAPTP